MEKLTTIENQKRLNQRINQIEVSGKIIIVFDFDELVVPVHLTKIVTRKLSKPVDESFLKRYGHCSFEGIRYLNHLLDGVKYDEYAELRDKTAAHTPWREGFQELLQALLKKSTLIFLSSGMKDIAYAKLKEIGFPEENVIGDEFEVRDNVINGSQLVVSEELKGYVVQKLREKHIVIAIGHSEGDRLMLQSATVSIGFNSAQNLAMYNTTSVAELKRLVDAEARK